MIFAPMVTPSAQELLKYVVERFFLMDSFGLSNAGERLKLQHATLVTQHCDAPLSRYRV